MWILGLWPRNSFFFWEYLVQIFDIGSLQSTRAIATEQSYNNTKGRRSHILLSCDLGPSLLLPHPLESIGEHLTPSQRAERLWAREGKLIWERGGGVGPKKTTAKISGPLSICMYISSTNKNRVAPFLKPNSWTYNFVEVSGHNLESSQTWGFRIQFLPYKPVSCHFWSRRVGGGE